MWVEMLLLPPAFRNAVRALGFVDLPVQPKHLA